MVSLQLKPDIILGFRWNHVIDKCNLWNNIEAPSEQITVLSAYSAHLRIWVEFKNVGWTKLKFYLYQNEEWFILNKKNIFFIKYLLRIY